MLFGISLEGRDDGEKVENKNKAFKFSDIFSLFFFLFFKDSFSEENSTIMGTEKVFSHGYTSRMTYREEGISTNPLVIVLQ